MNKVAILSCVVLCPSALADIKLPALLSDGVVIQQNAEARLWGWARPGEKVSVAPSWQKAPEVTRADGTGAWRVQIKTPPADGIIHTIVFSGDNQVVVKDVQLGEVWVCSGQSNMEWPLHATENAEQAIRGAANPAIRVFTVENTISVEPRSDCRGRWQAASPESVRNFSAVGYYFGREIQRKVGVPVGLIASDWGGTPAEAWTSEAGLRAHGEWEDALAEVARMRDDPDGLERERQAAVRAWLKQFDEAEPGSRAGAHWGAMDQDDSAWPSVEQPGAWGGALASHDGTVWARREVDVPASWVGKELKLELGPIDDNDTTYFNGEVVGERMGEGNWNVPRVYRVPGSLVKAGRAVIAVRMLDTGGPGGMMGRAEQLKLSVEGGDSLSLAGVWKLKAGAKLDSLPRRARMPGVQPGTPTSLFNGMIAPLTPMAIRGAIWYQGESNVGRALQYRTLFPAMIRDWRAAWGMADNAAFPFYYVQIAPFRYGGDKGEAAELREAQAMAMAVPNTGMAVTMDIGNPVDIHPVKKREVGERLALWALAKTYGKDVECSGPVMKSFAVKGGAVELVFEHAAGLNSGGKEVTHFTIAGEDRTFVPAKAVIEEGRVVVSAEGVAAPVAVRFAWGAADEPNLRNGAGLPAGSFRTDDWPNGK